jgi:transposase-like protein
MPETADLVVLVADPAGFAAEIFRTNHEEALSELLNDALLHYMRDPGWYEVTFRENRYYACQLVTIPLLAFIKNRVPARLLQATAERSLAQITDYSDVADPAAWIMINADFFSPLPRPGVNLWQTRKLKNSLNKAVFTDPGDITEPQKKPALPGVKSSADGKKDVASEIFPGNKRGPSADKIMERVMLGWRVKDICEEQGCSESYVYKLIKKRKGNSAMEYRWKQWELIAGMYHAEPKMTIEEIEQTCGVSRAVIYHAVKKIADRDGQKIIPREHERKLTPEDVEAIKVKLSQGILRKHILTEYSITNDTLIKYVGTHEDYRVISEELKDYAVRLRVQGKTLQQTADILGVTVATVKRAWSKKKDSPDIKEKRVKYDNRNVLSKRDRDQAVNAVLRDGHTRKQVYTQYGINALTLRRYIRDALKRETDALREDDNEKDGQGNS